MDKKPLIQQGWLRALLFLLLGCALSFAIDFIASRLLQAYFGNLNKQPENPQDFLMAYNINSIGFVVAAVCMRRLVDRQSFYSLGFKWKNNGDAAWSGFFVAMLILCMGTLVLWVFKCLYFIGFNFDASHIGLSILLFVVVAFVEEIIFRVYLLNNLMHSLNKWLALSISALIFALFHSGNPNASMLSVSAIFIAGILLGINYIYTKNIWFGIFFHFAWNFFQGTVLGYGVSGFPANGIFKQTLNGTELWTGGNFGFEASLLSPLLQIAAIILLAKRYKKMNASFG